MNINDYISRNDLLKLLDEKRKDWDSLRGQGHDVTTEEFLTNVIFMIDWLIDTVEKFTPGIVKTA